MNTRTEAYGDDDFFSLQAVVGCCLGFMFLFPDVIGVNPSSSAPSLQNHHPRDHVETTSAKRGKQVGSDGGTGQDADGLDSETLTCSFALVDLKPSRGAKSVVFLFFFDVCFVIDVFLRDSSCRDCGKGVAERCTA